jgi:hypothetical protein
MQRTLSDPEACRRGVRRISALVTINGDLATDSLSAWQCVNRAVPV